MQAQILRKAKGRLKKTLISQTNLIVEISLPNLILVIWYLKWRPLEDLDQGHKHNRHYQQIYQKEKVSLLK